MNPSIELNLNDDIDSSVYRTMSHFQTHSIVISNDEGSVSLNGTREQVKKVIEDLQKSIYELGW